MHLKILIGVLCIGLATASPKADPNPEPKPSPKASPQFIQGYPGVQPNYYPGGSSYFGQEIAPQPILGQPSAGSYGLSFEQPNYGPFGNAYSAQQAQQVQQVYPQPVAGNYYQSPQPVPLYPGGSHQYSVPVNQYEAARLWPKALISPAGSPSPVPDSLARAYYAVSTPSPLTYQSPSDMSVTPPAAPPSPQQPIPVPVKAYSPPPPVSTPPTYVTNYQKYTPPASEVQKYAHPTGFSFSTTSAPIKKYEPPTTRYPVGYQSTPAPFKLSYQQSTPAPQVQYQPTSSPFKLSYQQSTTTPQVQYQPTPAPYKYSFQQSAQSPQAQYQSTPAPRVQVQYQSTPPPPAQAQYQSTSAPRVQVQYQSTPLSPVQAQYQSTPAPPPQIKYQPTPSPPVQVSYKYSQQSQPAYYSTPEPYQFNYQFPGVSSRSPFAGYQQPTSAPYVDQYQQSLSPFGAQYQQPTASPFLADYQRIPVPVGYPQNTYQGQPDIQSASVPVTSKPITVVPTSPPPDRTVSITENTFIPIPTSPSPTSKPLATIVKSEYNAGTVSPQYNHIPLYSNASPYEYGKNAYLQDSGKSAYLTYAPMKPYAAYAPSTAVSRVSYNDLHHSYSY